MLHPLRRAAKPLLRRVGVACARVGAMASVDGGGSEGDWTMPLLDDWHLHVRDGEVMRSLMRDLPPTVSRAIIMPNLKPPVTTTAEALSYRDRIMAALPPGSRFQPLMTLYLTDRTPPSEIDAAVASGVVHAVKLYPAGATTHSDAGVTDIRRTYPTLSRMAEVGMPLLIHGEVTATEVDIFDREAVFIDTVLKPLVSDLPHLRIVLEHITTAQAVEFVTAAGPNIAATITAHHLLYNRNALFEGGIRPHRFCLPILKGEPHRAALVAAATSGNPKFFLGTDSAPHAKGNKECPCGAAGMFTALAAAELYASVFHAAGAGDKLVRFACEAGPDFYRLPRNADLHPGVKVLLKRETWRLPSAVPLTKGAEEGGAIDPSAVVVPIMAGEELHWKAYVV